ncbi:MAG: hypothetical protein CMN97_05490 [Synechococcus sp. NAT40]|nr:hypothetical protein [Synechococcus sp. NAT40]
MQRLGQRSELPGCREDCSAILVGRALIEAWLASPLHSGWLARVHLAAKQAEKFLLQGMPPGWNVVWPLLSSEQFQDFYRKQV